MIIRKFSSPWVCVYVYVRVCLFLNAWMRMLCANVKLHFFCCDKMKIQFLIQWSRNVWATQQQSLRKWNCRKMQHVICSFCTSFHRRKFWFNWISFYTITVRYYYEKLVVKIMIIMDIQLWWNSYSKPLKHKYL